MENIQDDSNSPFRIRLGEKEVVLPANFLRTILVSQPRKFSVSVGDELNMLGLVGTHFER